MKFDVGIIGGGVIGLACAWRLAQGGAKVGVFERGKIGREASWAAAGMLAAQCEAAHHPPHADQSTLEAQAAMFDLCLGSRALYPSFAQELWDASGIDIELSLHESTLGGDWRTPGIWYVRTRDDDPAPHAFERQSQAGHAVERLGEHVFRLPDEGQVENRKLAEALKVACDRWGVSIFESEAVEAVCHPNGRVVGLRTSQREVGCDKVLSCGGAWSQSTLGLPPDCLPPVRPIAGEILALRVGIEVPHIIYSSDVYLVPRRDGTLLIGATMEDRGFDKSIQEAAKTQLLQAATRVVPEVACHEIVDHWAGLRPASPDGLPILSATSLPNLFVATGHGRNGILLAPITARLMADHILRDAALPAAFSMSRFGNLL